MKDLDLCASRERTAGQCPQGGPHAPFSSAGRGGHVRTSELAVALAQERLITLMDHCLVSDSAVMHGQAGASGHSGMRDVCLGCHSN